MRHRSNGPDEPHWLALLIVILVMYAIAVAGGILIARSAGGAEPARKPTLALALDDGRASKMLKLELNRDWLKPNPAIVLTRKQKSDLAITGNSMNAMRRQLDLQFVILFVEREQLPMPQRLQLPAIRLAGGALGVDRPPRVRLRDAATVDARLVSRKVGAGARHRPRDGPGALSVRLLPTVRI